jgi:hypothetical protein
MNTQHDDNLVSISEVPGADKQLLPEFVAVIWSKRKLILACAIVFGCYGLVKVIQQKSLYRASVVMVPIHQRSSLSQGLDILNNLAFAGTETARPGVAEYLAVLRSVSFAKEFAQRHNLYPMLLDLALSGDDDEFNPWFSDSKQYTANRAGRLLSTHLLVRDDKKTGLIFISFEWPEKDNVAPLLNAMVDELNAQIKQSEIRLTAQSSAILEDKLAKTTLMAVQQSVGRVLEEEIKKGIIAQTEENTTFKILDRAVTPFRAIPAYRILTLGRYTLTGAILAVILVVLHWQLMLLIRIAKAASKTVA